MSHDPANRLYDEACSLLAAAEALRDAAEHPDSAPALAATLGCVEAALEALGTAASHLHCVALARHDERDEEVTRRTLEAAEISATFATLARALAASRTASAAARETTGRLITHR